MSSIKAHRAICLSKAVPTVVSALKSMQSTKIAELTFGIRQVPGSIVLYGFRWMLDFEDTRAALRLIEGQFWFFVLFCHDLETLEDVRFNSVEDELRMRSAAQPPDEWNEGDLWSPRARQHNVFQQVCVVCADRA